LLPCTPCIPLSIGPIPSQSALGPPTYSSSAPIICLDLPLAPDPAHGIPPYPVASVVVPPLAVASVVAVPPLAIASVAAVPPPLPPASLPPHPRPPFLHHHPAN